MVQRHNRANACAWAATQFRHLQCYYHYDAYRATYTDPMLDEKEMPMTTHDVNHENAMKCHVGVKYESDEIYLDLRSTNVSTSMSQLECEVRKVKIWMLLRECVYRPMLKQWNATIGWMNPMPTWDEEASVDDRYEVCNSVSLSRRVVERSLACQVKEGCRWIVTECVGSYECVSMEWKRVRRCIKSTECVLDHGVFLHLPLLLIDSPCNLTLLRSLCLRQMSLHFTRLHYAIHYIQRVQYDSRWTCYNGRLMYWFDDMMKYVMRMVRLNECENGVSVERLVTSVPIDMLWHDMALDVPWWCSVYMGWWIGAKHNALWCSRIEAYTHILHWVAKCAYHTCKVA